uniref:Uncharacterized protein n=1 Tax=Anguilla anguilla TaxID=7936 RepID=A0A0E9S6N5_ANGAN
MIICSSVYFVVLLLTVHFYHSTMFFITAYLGKPFSVPYTRKALYRPKTKRECIRSLMLKKYIS